MSRIAKKPIQVPANTTVKAEAGLIYVKGPLGEIKKVFPNSIDISVDSTGVIVKPKYINLETKALWGTFASHIKNMIAGVNKPYEKRMLVEGIGYKFDIKPTELVLTVGFSHPVKISIPQGVKVTADKQVLVITGIDKEAVGSFANNVKSAKKPEPYKGKGVRYENEVIRRKQGKKAA